MINNVLNLLGGRKLRKKENPDGSFGSEMVTQEQLDAEQARASQELMKDPRVIHNLDGFDPSMGYDATPQIQPVALAPWRQFDHPADRLAGKLDHTIQEDQRRKDEAEAARLNNDYKTLKSQIPDLDRQIQAALASMQGAAPQMAAPAANTTDNIAAMIAMLTGSSGNQAIGNLGQQAAERSQRDFQNATNTFNVDRQNAGVRMDYLQGMRSEKVRDAKDVLNQAQDIKDKWDKIDLNREVHQQGRKEDLEDFDRKTFQQLQAAFRGAKDPEEAKTILSMMKDVAARVPGLAIDPSVEKEGMAAATGRKRDADVKTLRGEIKAFNDDLDRAWRNAGEFTAEDIANWEKRRSALTKRAGGDSTISAIPRGKTTAQKRFEETQRKNNAPKASGGGGGSRGGGKSASPMEGSLDPVNPMNPFGEAAGVQQVDSPWKGVPDNALYARRRQVEKTLVTYQQRYKAAKMKEAAAGTVIVPNGKSLPLTGAEKEVILKYELALSEKQSIAAELKSRGGK